MGVAVKALQTNTNKLDAWTAERGLSFYSSRTVTMTFRKRIKEKRDQ